MIEASSKILLQSFDKLKVDGLQGDILTLSILETTKNKHQLKLKQFFL